MLLQHRALHLPEQKFGLNEYSDNEYSDNDERDKESSALQWNQMPLLYKNGHVPKTIPNSESHNLDVLDKSEYNKSL